ncbi:zinc finger, CCHC-type [Artemisia annua]|uniref:Zinc finger, CCHC-type n=1 Tax=Artemisia annua TaxID=35608 RepID=A0A2U1KXT8_ARTAN|nr:zinc finger, CCHC-type [Artemisia annua]
MGQRSKSIVKHSVFIRNKIPDYCVYLKDLINKRSANNWHQSLRFNRFEGGRRKKKDRTQGTIGFEKIRGLSWVKITGYDKTRGLFLERCIGGKTRGFWESNQGVVLDNVDEKTKKHKCEHCGHVNSSQERTERDKGKNWKPWKKKDGDQDKSQIRCYKCKELGHYKSECPKWEKEHEANLIQEDDEPTLL